MATPNTFSGFLSNLNSSSSLPNIDIMSNVGLYDNTPSTGVNSTYSAGYMYIGDLLIQFTTNPHTVALPLTSSIGTAITVTFPKSYTQYPYCVLASVYQSGTNLTVTVKNINYSAFDVATGNGTGYIQYIAIGPKPTS